MLQRPLGNKRLFDYDITAAWKRIPKCIVCGNEFCVPVRNARFSRRPMILDCCHSACEQCIFANRAHFIHCKECDITTTFDRRPPIRAKAEFNYYLYGFISYIDYNLQNDLTYTPLTSKNIEVDGQNECSECNQEYTNYICMQCSVPYCKNCFNKVHKFGKALQKHSLTLLERNTIIISEKDFKKCCYHKRIYDQYCSTCKRVICTLCIPDGHNSHVVKAIANENQKYVPKIHSLIETVKIAKEYNRQAQKDVKMIERKYEEFATDAVESVFKYFTSLHIALQRLERNLLFEIKQKVMNPINKAKVTHATFVKSHETLEEVKNTLQRIANDPPNILLSKIIERTNTALETTACNVEVEEPCESPFNFTVLKDAIKEVEKCYKMKMEEMSFKSKILSFYGDANSCSDQSGLEEKFQSIALEPYKNKKKGKISKKLIKPLDTTPPMDLNLTVDISPNLNQTRSFSVASIVNSQKVHVSHIKSPEHFYVQNQIFLSVATEFKEFCSDEANYAATPDYIEIDEIYLVFNPSDKSWYRGKVVDSVRTDVYKVFLVDFGDNLECPKQRFREIPDDLRLRPYGAIECSLYGIKPKGEKWTDEANHLISEIIMNKMVVMIVLKDNEPVSLVDLVANHNKYPTSLRDALIYTNLAEEIPIASSDDLAKRISTLDDIKKNLIPTVKTRFFKNVFKEGENFRVTVLNIINPQEYYAMKYDHKDDLKKLQEDINQEYEKNQEKIFSPQQNMPCAVFVNGDWFRARFIKTLEEGYNKVWLVDQGHFETVNWKQIRILDDKFLINNEFAFQCSLIDIEPLQENDYSWTSESIAEFKRITKNPVLQIFIHRAKEFRYKVVLYVIKKNVDINVNGLLVKYHHAIATGPESTCVEHAKHYLKNSPKIDKTKVSEANVAKPKVTSSTTRTKIKISHIVSPGEFYVHMVNHINGIAKLHKEIQLAQSKKDQFLNSKVDWDIGENCLVFAALKRDGTPQWYRAIITEVNTTDDKNDYTVFLCDHGNKLHKISCQQLSEIDTTFSRVCNGAIQCHLACVQPTGGLESWSYSSIDEFKNLTNKYEAFGACIQGKRKENSIPVVLYGLTTEFSDPLSPNICKWIMINKVLVNCGLAHLTEKFDTAQQVEDVFENELQLGQETFEHWIEFFNTQIDNVITENNENEPERSLELEIVDEILDGEIEAWPPAEPINKSVFTAYPTYVDNDAVVYLHDAINHHFLNRMKESINKKIADTEPEENLYWYTGQPCLARYHADNSFYRAVVLETKPGQTISVQFVDYGNVEDCSTSDLRKQIMMDKIPIQANKYRIDRIAPKDSDSSWPVETLDFIHAQIVGKLCTIRVAVPDQEENTIKRCSIRFGNSDIAELLWNASLASKIPHIIPVEVGNSSEILLHKIAYPKKIKKNTPKKDQNVGEKPKTSISSEEEIILSSAERTPAKDNMDPEEYQKMFEKIELENLYKSIAIPSDEGNSDEDIVELEFTYQLGYWQSKCGDSDLEQNNEKDNLVMQSGSSSISSFNPKETSSVKSHHFAGIDKFAMPTIPHGMLKFYSEVTFLRDCTNLYIFPFLTEHQQRFSELSRRIQHHAKSLQTLPPLEPNTPCLALYAVDNLWYRAMIRSYFPDIEKVDVLFVDFLNAEMVTTKMIRKIPKHLLEIPLRTIQVRISGVKPNPRWREIDIQRKLSDTLAEYKKVFVKIVKPGKLPEVQLYDSQNESKLVYEKLITERFYLKDD